MSNKFRPEMVKDINPQMIGKSLVESAANTFTETSLDLPVMLQGSKPIVIELLRVWIDASSPMNEAAGQRNETETFMSMRELGGIPDDGLADPFVITHTSIESRGGAESSLYTTHPNYIFDFTDGKGNGILIAVPKLWCSIQGTGNTGAKTGRWKLLYRLKTIHPSELTGLIMQFSG